MQLREIMKILRMGALKMTVVCGAHEADSHDLQGGQLNEAVRQAPTEAPAVQIPAQPKYPSSEDPPSPLSLASRSISVSHQTEEEHKKEGVSLGVSFCPHTCIVCTQSNPQAGVRHAGACELTVR